MTFDAVCSQQNVLYAAVRSSHVIYELSIKKNGFGLTAKKELVSNNPDGVQTVSDITVHAGRIFIASAGEHGGIMHYQNKTWVSVLQSTQDVHVHGLAFLNELLLFTDPKHHRICTHKDNQVQTWAGSDREGSQDGPVMLSSFGQPTGKRLQISTTTFT